MKEKFNIVFVLLLILFPLEASSQFYSEALGGYMLNQVVYKGDTIPYVELKEVPVYPKLKNKKLEKFYWKTVRDVKLVYPYVKIVAKEYAMINAKFDTIVDKKQRMKYTKKYEKQLLKKYEPTMREFTLSQGKMMIKLIDREMDKVCANKRAKGRICGMVVAAFCKDGGS